MGLTRTKAGRLAALAAGALLAAAALAACGGGDDGGGAAGPASTAGATTTTARDDARYGIGGGSTATTKAGAGASATSAPPAPARTVTACGGAGGKAVTVGLKEFAVSPTPAGAKAGAITFKAVNQGTVAHQLLVVRTPSPSALPTGANGGVDTGQVPRADLLAAVKPFAPGASCALTLHLTPGSYALFCNIVGDGVSHYQRGMVNVFTVG